MELVGHVGAVNGIAWAPSSVNHICTVGEDRQALIWDINTKVRGDCGDIRYHMMC